MAKKVKKAKERVIRWEETPKGWRLHVLGQEPVEVDMGELSPEIIEKLARHGLKQKVGDAAAKSEGASAAEKYASMLQVLEQLRRGEWTTRATGGLVVEAIARVKGLDLAEAANRWSQLDDAQKRAVRKHPEVVRAMREIELERAQAALKNAPELKI